MPLLGDMISSFEQLLNERLGIVDARITSAKPLADADKEQLDRALRARTGKQVRMSFSLDPNLIGGVLAQVGSTIYDGSVRGQLERLRSELAGSALK
jgi:F-type H+-transporting ATPase subunit delta